MSEAFSDQLASLCSREGMAIARDPERGGAAIEALARCLALTMCRAAKGDPAMIETLWAGVENYVMAEATSWAPLMQLMSQHPNPKDPSHD